MFTDETALSPILAHINNAGLGFVYDGDVKQTKFKTVGDKIGLSNVIARRYLDETQHDAQSVRQSITLLQSEARDAVPIGMGFSYAGTIDGVKTWLASKPNDIEIAPVSYAIKKQK